MEGSWKVLVHVKKRTIRHPKDRVIETIGPFIELLWGCRQLSFNLWLCLAGKAQGPVEETCRVRRYFNLKAQHRKAHGRTVRNVEFSRRLQLAFSKAPRACVIVLPTQVPQYCRRGALTPDHETSLQGPPPEVGCPASGGAGCRG